MPFRATAAAVLCKCKLLGSSLSRLASLLERQGGGALIATAGRNSANSAQRKRRRSGAASMRKIWRRQRRRRLKLTIIIVGRVVSQLLRPLPARPGERHGRRALLRPSGAQSKNCVMRLAFDSGGQRRLRLRDEQLSAFWLTRGRREGRRASRWTNRRPCKFVISRSTKVRRSRQTQLASLDTACAPLTSVGGRPMFLVAVSRRRGRLARRCPS